VESTSRAGCHVIVHQLSGRFVFKAHFHWNITRRISMQTNNANLLSKSTVVVEIRTSVATVIAGVLIFFFSIPPSVQAAGGLICDVDLSPPLITVTTPQRAEFIESSSD
jgi:hypothetical protein